MKMTWRRKQLTGTNVEDSLSLLCIENAPKLVTENEILIAHDRKKKTYREDALNESSN